MRKVLIITYYWPPAGGPGVQRVLKFAKYLPEFGWEPVILTVKNGEYPAVDESLLNDVPPGIKVYKTKSVEPFSVYKRFTGDTSNKAVPVAVLSQKNLSFKKRVANFIRLNLIIPDAKIGWKFSAIKEIEQIIKTEKPDVIFSSSPPPTVHLIAKRISKQYNIKWVADLRDPWSNIHYYQNNRSSLACKIDSKLEKDTLVKADKIVTVSNNFAQLIYAEKDKLNIIPNGFDDTDFSSEGIEKDSTCFNVSYIGGLNENRFYPEFFEKLKEFAKEKSLTPYDIKLTFAGSILPEYENKIKDILGANVKIDYAGYLSHNAAIKLMYRSDVLLLFMEKVSHYSGHIPGKLFEYLATGNYILGIGDKTGNAQKILEDSNGGEITNDFIELPNLLNKLYTNWQSENLKGAEPPAIEKYSRKNLTKQLAELFDSL